MSGGLPTIGLRQLPYPERSRFVPQYDEEIWGRHEALRTGKDYINLPNDPTSGTLPTVYCGVCETTWLVGFDGVQSAKHHPFHNTLFHEYSGQSRRSTVVHVFAACSGDDATSGRSYVGIFFGDGSSYNLDYNLNSIVSTPRPTKQTVEILIATDALRKVRETVRPRREEAVRGNDGVHFECCWRDGWITPPLEYHRNN
jgi:hypothetical protein